MTTSSGPDTRAGNGDPRRDEETRAALSLVQQTLAEIRGQLSATLPHHAARLDEHDRRIGEHDVLLRDVTAKQAADAAAAASELRAAERAGRLPNWVTVTMMVAGIVGVVGAIWAAAK
jgi:hypothetical protein